MAQLNHDQVGKWHDERTFEVTPEAIEKYADAVNDPNAAYRKGEDSIAPPLFGIVSGWDAMAQPVGETVPGDLLIQIVHLIQDMRFERPIRAGDTLHSRGRVAGIVGGERGTSVVAHVETKDSAGELVGEFYATSYIRGHTGEESTGDPSPDLSTDRQGDPVAEVTQKVDDDQTYRYAEASGDNNPIHVNEDIAKSVGLPGIINHGMCTLAFAAWAAVENLADGDSTRLRRFAGRFSRPLLPGQEITTRFYAAGESDGKKVFGYTTEGPDGPVIKDGLVEVE